MLPGGGGLEQPPGSGSGGFVTILLQHSGDVDDASTPKTSIVPNPRPRTISVPVLPKEGSLLQLWVSGFVFGPWSDAQPAGIVNPCGIGVGMGMGPSGVHGGGRAMSGIGAQLWNTRLSAAEWRHW